MDGKQKIDENNLNSIAGGVATGTSKSGASYTISRTSDGNYKIESANKSRTFSRDELANVFGNAGQSCAEIDEMFLDIDDGRTHDWGQADVDFPL